MTRFAILIIITLGMSGSALGQLVPGEFEHIEFLTKFGKDCPTEWGDDDYSQTFFFVIPKAFTHPIYIRVFDPDVGGQHDVINGAFNTKMKYQLYGGPGAYTNPDARAIDPVGEYKSGILLASKVFGMSEEYDNKWYAIGPINPLEGEFVDQFDGHIFKLITEGVTGDDGNLYKYFLSTQFDNNKEVEGANAFTFEYSFRLPVHTKEVVHLYPFIDRDVVSITQHNFDLDNIAHVMLYSVAKNRIPAGESGNDIWIESRHQILDAEKNTTLDLQILTTGDAENDVVAYITNQHDEAIAFFSNPIGGPPKYRYKVDVKKTKND